MKCDEIAWQTKGGSVTHLLFVMGWNVIADKRGVPLTCCWSWDEMWWDCLSEKGWSVTHKLLVIGWYVMRLPGREKGAVSLTCCWSWYDMWWDCLAENRWQVLLTSYWSWDEMWWDCLGENMGECYSQAVGHGMKCNEISLQQKGGSVTHSLLVMGWNVMKLPGREKGRSVTHILLVIDEMWWYCLAEKRRKCHPLAVGHGMKYSEISWKMKRCVTYMLLIMGWDVTKHC